MSEQLSIGVKDSFVVFFDSGVVVDVQVFDPGSLVQRGRIVVDFDILSRTVPNYSSFLGKSFVWSIVGLEYFGG